MSNAPAELNQETLELFSEVGFGREESRYNEEDVLDLFLGRFSADTRLRDIQKQSNSNLLVTSYNLVTKKIKAVGTSTYDLNSLGCRSVEFYNSPTLLVAGCSHTFGIGVPLEGTWGEMLARQLDVDYVNTAISGASTSTIVNNIFAYIRKFGAPKKIALLLPDLYRMTVVESSNYISIDGQKSDFYYAKDYSFDGKKGVKDRPKFSKSPHSWKDLLPAQMPIMYAVRSLNSLIQYCKDSGIDFVWSTWASREKELFRSLAESDYNEDGFYSQYVYVRRPGAQESGCHYSLSEAYGKLFVEAEDSSPDSGYYGHIPIHSHAHFADEFAARLSGKH